MDMKIPDLPQQDAKNMLTDDISQTVSMIYAAPEKLVNDVDLQIEDIHEEL